MKDLMVRTGEYQNAQGETKGRWKKCGIAGKNKDGKPIIGIDPTFNFAGVDRDGDMIFLSMFDQKPRDQQNQGYPSGQQNAQPPTDMDPPF